MENDDSLNPTISADAVISKLKDDGDFDRLRLKIIRKLKENEELRNNIISVVRQSAALNRPGAENMKPRQLSDAIHNEVGEKVMSQISDGIWDIIRSGDEMKTEIKETVKSVYCKLSNPEGNTNGQQSSPSDTLPAGKGPDNSGQSKDPMDDSEWKGPPGFTHSDDPLADNNETNEQPAFTHSSIHQNNQEEGLTLEAKKAGPHRPEDVDLSAPPGFSVATDDHKQRCDGSDEDPDLPPGFGG